MSHVRWESASEAARKAPSLRLGDSESSMATVIVD